MLWERTQCRLLRIITIQVRMNKIYWVITYVLCFVYNWLLPPSCPQSTFNFILIINSLFISFTESSNSGSNAVTIGTCRMPFPQLLEQISQILSFMWSEVFCGNIEVRKCPSSFDYLAPWWELLWCDAVVVTHGNWILLHQESSYCIVLYRNILFCVVLYCIALYCIVTQPHSVLLIIHTICDSWKWRKPL